ncbi:MAG: DUF983 domain-containing protein [Pseudomonadota bacterium]|nr:DUF983 domain-containing protein [Pseudomonadota bacterium]
MWRGSIGKCPACGSDGLFARYLKVANKCETCGVVLAGQQADDAPPYFTILIVGHIVIPIALIVERTYQPPLIVHAAMFSLVSVIITLISLSMVKGAVVGLQWALRMHGFADTNTTFVEETDSQ